MTRFCKYCGNQISAKARFCKHCGGFVGKSRELGRKRLLISSSVALFMVAVLVITAFWKPGFFWRIKYRETNNALRIAFVPDDVFSEGMDKYFDETLPVESETEDTENEYNGTRSALSWSDEEMASATVLTAMVSPDEPKAVFDGGITVDFGDVNLSTNSELTVRVSGEKSVPEENIVSARRYELSMDDRTEFAESVEVTVPYNAKGEGQYPEVSYYNSETGLHEPMVLDYNEDEGTVTFYTTHFSPFDVLTSEVPDYKELSPNVKVNPNFRMFELALQDADPNEIYANALLKNYDYIVNEVKDYAGNASDFCTFSGIPVSFIDVIFDMSKATGLANAYPRLALASKFGGNFIAGIGVLMAGVQILADAKNTGSLSEAFIKTIKNHGFDLAACTISILGIASVISAPVAFVGGLVVTAASLIQRVNEGYNRELYNGHDTPQELSYYTFSNYIVFDSYTGAIHLKYDRATRRKLQGVNPYIDWKACSDEKDAEERIDSIYKYNYNFNDLPVSDEDKQQLEKALRDGRKERNDFFIDYAYVPGTLSMTDSGGWTEVMAFCRKNYGLNNALSYFEKYVDTYCNYFWTASLDVKKAFTKHGNLNNRTRGAVYVDYRYDPDQETITEMKNALKAKIMQNCRPLFEKVYKDMWVEARQKSKQAFKGMVDGLNATVTFNIDIKDKNGKNLTLEEAGYKKNYIVLDSSYTKYPINTPWEAKKDSLTMFECTFVSYLLMGEPDKFLVYKDEKAYLNGEKPIDTLGFKFSNPVTTVTKSIDIDIFGTWNITQTIESLGSQKTNDLVDQSKKTYEQFKEELERDGQVLDEEQMLEYYNQLYGMYDQYLNTTYTGKLVITDAGDGAVTAKLTYETGGAPAINYVGSYDKETGIITLKNTSPQQLDPGLTIPVKNEGGKLTFSIEVNYESYMATYSYSMTGVKTE